MVECVDVFLCLGRLSLEDIDISELCFTSGLINCSSDNLHSYQSASLGYRAPIGSNTSIRYVEDIS